VDPSILPEATSVADLPRIVLNRKNYVKREWIHKKRAITSWVQEHGCILIELNNDGGELLLITDQRNRLSDDIIEAVECLKHWYEAKVF
jgi:hypothetical protein